MKNLVKGIGVYFIVVSVLFWLDLIDIILYGHIALIGCMVFEVIDRFCYGKKK